MPNCRLELEIALLLSCLKFNSDFDTRTHSSYCASAAKCLRVMKLLLRTARTPGKHQSGTTLLHRVSDGDLKNDHDFFCLICVITALSDVKSNSFSNHPTRDEKEQVSMRTI